jgi:hypothetical protein
MTIKDTWADGDTFAAADENAIAAQVNTNTADIANRVTGQSSSVDSEVALFSGTGGKTVKRATGSGIAKLSSGVLGTATSGTDYAPATSGSSLLKGNGTGGFSAAAAGTDFVAPGGALGTPSSGTLTNCTGLPVAGVAASTATALGVGSVELGHATDTTLSRASAGNLAVEGNLVYRAGGTDVPITDGGTGASTLPSGLLKGAGTGAITAATAGTDYYAPGSTDVAVADGGTGASTLTGIVKGNGTSAFTAATAGTDYVTPTGTETLSGKTLTNPTVNNYVEGVVANGTVTTAKTLDLTNGTVQTATLTASTACTFTMPTATAGKSFLLILNQAASTGNGTATFTGVKWPGGTGPTVTATAGAIDVFSFVADGTNWYGTASQAFA